VAENENRNPVFRALATIVIIRALTHHHQSSHHLTTTMTSEQAAPLFVLFRPREKVELHIFRTKFLLFSDAANSASLRPGRRFYERRI
jgi:hypothetical protein